MYRIGLPGWKLAARWGVPLSVRVTIHHDTEAASYWTSSPDLGGLIVTGNDLDELWQEVRLALPDLIALEIGKPAPVARAVFSMDDHLQLA